MIHVIATIETVDGQRDALVDAFRKLTPQVLAEDGCIEYGAAVDAATDIGPQIDDRPNVVTVVEKWESVDALKAHLAIAHMEEFRARCGEWIKSISLQILDPA
ncbi:MAG: antibiotic biosynthesis monooxygenase [Pirellulales bacterium]|nr:antibiotic biosynthesis monooxygenase [Pirellulales bacterium]